MISLQIMEKKSLTLVLLDNLCPAPTEKRLLQAPKITIWYNMGYSWQY